MKNKNMPFIITLTVAFLVLVGSITYFTTKNSTSKNESSNTDTAEAKTKADNGNVANDSKTIDGNNNVVAENSNVVAENSNNTSINRSGNGNRTSGNNNSSSNDSSNGNNGSSSNGNGNNGNGDNGSGNNGSEQEKPMWTLAWSDEFSGNSLDTTKWKFDEGNWGVNAEGAAYPGWGNQEKQNYIKGDNNTKIEDGQLIITAKKEQTSDKYGGPYEYTSAKVTTKDLFSKKYGKFEIKAKLPEGKGLWPAIWMLPQGEKYGQWAASGELDIMEAWGSKTDSVRGTLHFGQAHPNNTQNGKESSQDATFKAKHPNFKTTDYHTYSVEWEPDGIKWYIDGDIYQTITSWYSTGVNQPDKYAFPAPFDKNFYLILNLAVGGAWDGEPDSKTLFPSSMAVDYVRVYEKTGEPYNEPIDRSSIKDEYPAAAKLPLGDGNFVYNNNFDKDVTGVDHLTGVPNTAYWSFLGLPQYDGAASVSIESITNRNFAHIDISKQGNQDYALQFIQRVTVGRARAYRLTFDAKSSGDRNIAVKIGGDENRGYTVYSGNYKVPLTSEVKTYSYSFNMASETDLNARLEFNVGNNLNDVWIGNVKLEEIQLINTENDKKKPLGSGEHIYNGAFDLGYITRMTYWNINTVNGQAKGTVNPDTREIKIVADPGDNGTSSISLDQRGVELREKCTYKVSFKARLEGEQGILAKLMSLFKDSKSLQVYLTNEDGSINYSSVKEFELTEDMKEYSFEFTPDTSDSNSKIVFNLGGDKKTVYLDDISMIRTKDFIDYSNIDQLFFAQNGSFADGLSQWDNYIDAAADAVITAENGEAKISVNKPGTERWNVMLQQPASGESYDMKEGIDYQISFDARATVNREIDLSLETSSYVSFLNKKINLTNTKQNYSFNLRLPSDQLLTLKLLMGNLSGADKQHDVFIDNVRVEVAGAREISFPTTNGDFNNNLLAPWTNAITSSGNATMEVADGKLTADISNGGTNLESITTSQVLNKNIVGGVTYLIGIDGKVSNARDVKLVLVDKDGNYQYEKNISLKTINDRYVYEFKAAKDFEGSIKLLMGGYSEIGTHKITIDNIFVEAKGAREEALPTVEASSNNPNNGNELVTNVSFDSIIDPWALSVANWDGGPGADATAEIENKQAKINVKNVGTDNWNVQFKLNPLTITKGHKYKLSFDVKSSIQRDIELAIQHNGGSYETFFLMNGIVASPTGNHYEYEFTVDKETDSQVQFVYNLGKVGNSDQIGEHIVYFDNVSLIDESAI